MKVWPIDPLARGSDVAESLFRSKGRGKGKRNLNQKYNKMMHNFETLASDQDPRFNRIMRSPHVRSNSDVQIYKNYALPSPHHMPSAALKGNISDSFRTLSRSRLPSRAPAHQGFKRTFNLNPKSLYTPNATAKSKYASSDKTLFEIDSSIATDEEPSLFSRPGPTTVYNKNALSESVQSDSDNDAYYNREINFNSILTPPSTINRFLSAKESSDIVPFSKPYNLTSPTQYKAIRPRFIADTDSSKNDGIETDKDVEDLYIGFGPKDERFASFFDDSTATPLVSSLGLPPAGTPAVDGTYVSDEMESQFEGMHEGRDPYTSAFFSEPDSFHVEASPPSFDPNYNETLSSLDLPVFDPSAINED